MITTAAAAEKRILFEAVDDTYLYRKRVIPGRNRVAEYLLSPTSAGRGSIAHWHESVEQRNYFGEVLNSIWSEMRLPDVDPQTAKSKRNLIRIFLSDLARLERMCQEVGDLLRDAVLCSLATISYARPDHRQRLSDAMTKLGHQIVESVGLPTIPRGLDLTADFVDVTDILEFQERLLDALRSEATGLASSLFATLDACTERLLFGAFEKLTPNAGRLWYMTRHIVLSSKNLSAVVGGVALHIHDIVNVRFTRVPRYWRNSPHWLDGVLSQLPKFLRRVPGLIQIVAGETTMERVIVRESERADERLRRNRNYVPDPALLVCGYVLAAWDDQDVKCPFGNWREWRFGGADEGRSWEDRSKTVHLLRGKH